MESELNNETKELVKAGLNLEENILKLGLVKWGNKLKNFEKEYKMSSDEFFDKFNKGNLGDDKKWFEWLFAYKSYHHIKNKLNIIKTINL